MTAAVSSKVKFPTLPSIRDILRLYDLRARKQLSQNFLLDPSICAGIVHASGHIRPETKVIEVGPGPGGITREILKAGVQSLIVIEKDRRFIPSLHLLAEAVEPRMKIVCGDVLSFNMAHLFPEESKRDWQGPPPPIALIGNLPFSVSTYLVIQWIKDMTLRRNAWSCGRVPMTLTFQSDVVDRMFSKPGDAIRSRIGIMTQLYTDAVRRMTIKGASFVPAPKVDAGVVCFTPKYEPLVPGHIPFEFVERFVRIVFNHKNSFIHRGIGRLLPVLLQENVVPTIIAKSGVARKTKIVDLGNEEICRLIVAYWDVCQKLPGVQDYDNRSRLTERLSGVEWEEQAKSLFPLRWTQEELRDLERSEREGRKNL